MTTELPQATLEELTATRTERDRLAIKCDLAKANLLDAKARIASLESALTAERERREGAAAEALDGALTRVYSLKRRFGLVDAKDVGAQAALTMVVELLARMVLDARKPSPIDSSPVECSGLSLAPGGTK